jgi:hypothetical protein
MHCLHSIYLTINLYMFRAGLLLIIRRYSLYILQLVCIVRLCWLAASRIGVEEEFHIYQLLLYRE